jgi:hypothetical protein
MPAACDGNMPGHAPPRIHNFAWAAKLALTLARVHRQSTHCIMRRLRDYEVLADSLGAATGLQGNGSTYVEHDQSSVRNGALVEAKADE